MMIPTLGKRWWLIIIAALFTFCSNGLITDYIIPIEWTQYSSIINGFLSTFALLAGLYGVYLQINVKIKVQPAKSKSKMLKPHINISNSKEDRKN